MTSFQAILLGIFSVAIIAGVIFFGVLNDSKSSQVANIVVWGTVDSSSFNAYVRALIENAEQPISTTYVQKNREMVEADLLKALADGVGPDVVLLEQDQIIANQKRLYELPYEYYNVRDFKDTFIQEGELFLTETGIIAFPFTIDPLVTYWNRDILSSEGIAVPPRYWDEFLTAVPKLTKRDSSLNVYQSAVALGEFVNVAHAKDILSALILQAGNPIIVKNDIGYTSLINEKLGFSISPAESALNFYTEFSNPTKDSYSWNRSLPYSTDRFLSGDLALYFGYASELPDIKKKNPNLNFDVTYFPQPRQNPEGAITYGRMVGFAILKNSPKIAAAHNTIQILTSKNSLALWQQASLLPPVRRDLLVEKANNPYSEIFNGSAVRARGWLDPDKYETELLFKEMIESVVSGKYRISEAIQFADIELDAMFTN